MKFEHCKYSCNNGLCQIIAQEGYSTFNTVCLPYEAEELCRIIDSVIKRLKKWKLWFESLQQEEQDRIAEEKEKSFKRFLKSLEELKELDGKRKKELMEAIKKWLDEYFEELQRPSFSM